MDFAYYPRRIFIYLVRMCVCVCVCFVCVWTLDINRDKMSVHARKHGKCDRRRLCVYVDMFPMQLMFASRRVCAHAHR